jgi:hypothetical protein
MCVSKPYFILCPFKTVFAPESGRMRTFDKKNLGKTPPPFPHTPQKNLGRRVCVDRVEHIFCGASREFFLLEFKNMTGKGTITILGGNKSLIKKLQKSRNSEYITKSCV